MLSIKNYSFWIKKYFLRKNIFTLVKLFRLSKTCPWYRDYELNVDERLNYCFYRELLYTLFSTENRNNLYFPEECVLTNEIRLDRYAK